MSLLLCNPGRLAVSPAGPQPASGGAGTAGRHHPQADGPHPGGRPKRLTVCLAGAESAGRPLLIWYTLENQSQTCKGKNDVMCINTGSRIDGCRFCLVSDSTSFLGA